MQVTISRSTADIKRAGTVLEVEQAAERAAVTRIRAHEATKRNANTPIELLAVNLAALEAEQAEHEATRARLVELRDAEQAAIDVDLNPLQDQCYTLAQSHDFGERAERVRARRGALVQQRATAEKPIRDFDRRTDDHARRLAQRITDARGELQRARTQAEFDSTSAADFEKAAKSARFKLQAARDDVRLAREATEHYRAKLAEAHDTVNAEEDAVHALAELVGKRKGLQANSFISGKSTDADQLADLNRRIADSEKSLEQIKTNGAGARAAVGKLEEKIVEQQRIAADAHKRVGVAEAALTLALANLERRLTTDADREHGVRMQAIRERLQSFREVDTESL